MRTPDRRHWWQLTFIALPLGGLAGVFITECDELEIAIARAELQGVRPPACDLSATPFLAEYVHADYLDILLTGDDMISMPPPVGFTKTE
jgi:hypothetical protein